MTDRELFIQAWEALTWNLPVIEDHGNKEQLNIQHNAITALSDRLEQPEQEKDWDAVAEKQAASSDRADGTWTPLYIPPQKRECIRLMTITFKSGVMVLTLSERSQKYLRK